MQETTNYKLKKLELTDFADITELNSNADIVDAELKKHNNDIETIKNSYVTSFNGKTGAVVLPIATKQDAEAGVDDTKMMTSARVKEAVNKFAPLKTVNGQQPDEYGNVNVEEYTHPSSGVSAGTYDSVTVDKNGHVTAGSNPSRVTSINGKTGAVTIATYTHPSSGVNAGTYRKVTVNAQGHVTGGENPTLAVSEGGTGATNITNALTNLGIIGALTGVSVSGRTLTFTKKDGSEVSVNTQDTSNGIVAQSLGQNGYVKFANGLILQWGFAQSSSSEIPKVTVTYPITLSTLINAQFSQVWNDTGEKYAGRILWANTKQIAVCLAGSNQSISMGCYVFIVGK